MKKGYSMLVLAFLFSMANATNYYVDAVNGNNSYNGQSTAQAFKTISTAAALTNAGDTVFILNGSYNSFTISRSGSVAGQIVYTAYPGHFPKVVSQETTYNVITVSPGTGYITINGLEIVGWGVNLSLANDTIPAQAAIVCPAGATSTTNVTFIPKYNGSGINIGSGSSGAISHHIVVSNNKVHDCAAVGISNGWADYITIEGNTVYNNSWYNPYGTSGISFGNSVNYDNDTVNYRTIVRNNICYNNRLYVLWRGSCTISDGNGIILDIPRPDYNGRTLVANNICYNNGGSGIHTLSTNHVDFLNNVVYLNSASPTNGGGSLYAYAASDVKFYNNIVVARPGKPIARSPNSTNVIYDYNVYYGGSSIDYVGAHSLIQDPKFVSATTDPLTADFRLQQGSFAINNGDNTHTLPADRNGTPRPVAGVVDIGAYESSYTGNLNDCSGTTQTKQLSTSGIGTGEAGAIFYGPYDTKPATSNSKSRRAFIYPQTLLTLYGVPATATLTSLQFRRSLQISSTNTAPSTQVVPDNGFIKVYLRNEASDNFGVAAFDWNTILPTASSPAVLVYAGEAATLIGNSGGWKTVPFQIPFAYTGSNLGVYIEYSQKGVISGGTDINWVYDNGGSQPLFNTTTYPNQQYGTKAITASGSTVISDNLTTNSERRPVLTVGYCVSGGLPVSLLSFNAVKKGSGVFVNWTVTHEINNAGFEVQRSKDGRYFEPIGFVAAKATGANSNAVNSYAFTDASPISGTGFYRLLQRDKDGKITYSTIVRVTNDGKRFSIESIYPNPADAVLHATVNIDMSQEAVVSVQDISGKTISAFKTKLAAGSNAVQVPVAKLAGTTYLLVVELPGGEKLISRFIKK